jgi:hypothetical protein
LCCELIVDKRKNRRAEQVRNAGCNGHFMETEEIGSWIFWNVIVWCDAQSEVKGCGVWRANLLAPHLKSQGLSRISFLPASRLYKNTASQLAPSCRVVRNQP